ncbi:restriction endonuclease subunit S [Acinetobacter sp.]|uniref:restriction endonuclease subunit S n=1 Tax=Acinetobacter sp. TaxID=472 RepID=UPI00333E8AE8
MTDVKKLITEHLDIWLTAETEKKSGRGRSSGSTNSIYGVQKLRELILELAFLGKLVPNETNPFNLLEQILSEQKELVKNKILKKTTDVNILENSEFNYSLPNTWVLLKLGDSGYNLGQKIPTSKFSYIDVSAINSLYGRVENQSILNAEDAPSRARKIVRLGTVIYSTVRPYLNNIAVIDKVFEYEPIASTAFAVIHPYKAIDSYYLFYYLRSPLFIKYVESQQVGIAYPAINDKQFFSGVLPVPSLEEQKRIVAKVDELMQLCDQLEQQQNLSSEAHDQLVDTLLNVLTNSSDADEFQQNWQCISENFDLLFITEYSVEQLKQTILQLAVMGKLVKQDSNYEPASELLNQIAEEKAKLVKEGKIKKSKLLLAITEEEKLFELPSGWELVRLGNICLITSGNAFSSQDFLEGNGLHKVIKITNIGVGEFIESSDYLNIELNKKIEGFQVFKNDLLLALTRPYISTGLKVCQCPESYDKALLNQRVSMIRPFSRDLNDYLYLFMRSGIVLNIYKKRFSDSGLQPNLKMEDVNNLVVPLPPLSEQKHILEQIHQLFSLIEKLQELQSKLQITKLHLADSLIANALSSAKNKNENEAIDNIIQFEKPIEAIKQRKQKSADQIDLFTNESVDDDLKLLSLAAEITFQLHTEPTFGHLKLQKLIYLCQQLKHMDLAADFKQHAAGPYDPVMARYLDKEFKDHEWFSYDPKRDLKYKPLSRCNDHRSAFNKYFAKDVSEIYDLIGLFRTSKSDHIEIVATLFACWLRLLEQKRLVTEEQLLKDFYAWSEEKKKFGKNEVLNGYKWMKIHSLTPIK